MTAALSSSVLFGMGDCIAQQGIQRKGLKNHDLAATGRMALYGGCVFGPVATFWFRALERFIVVKRSRTFQMLARVTADQAVFAPVHLAVFLTSMSLLEGVNPQIKLQESYWPGLKANWSVWPIVQIFNFSIVPLDLRVLVVNVISLGWNSYLSYLNTRSPIIENESEDDDEDEVVTIKPGVEPTEK